MGLEWGYFRQLYEGLYDHHDDVAGRRRYLSGQQRTAADHLAGLAPLRKREQPPAGGYTGDDEQLWRIMKLYGLSRVSDYLIALFGDDPPLPKADRLDDHEDPLDQRRELLLHR